MSAFIVWLQRRGVPYSVILLGLGVAAYSIACSLLSGCSLRPPADSLPLFK